METINTFSRDELQTVVRWLEDRKKFLSSERMVIEAGDDFAFANGRWPTVQTLMRDEISTGRSLKTAMDQLGAVNDQN